MQGMLLPIKDYQLLTILILVFMCLNYLRIHLLGRVCPGDGRVG